MLVAIFLSLASFASAASTCDVVEGFEKSSVVCGSRESELFLKDQERVVALKLSVEDKTNGRSRELHVSGVNLKISQLKGKNFLILPKIKSALTKLRKEWGAEPSVQIQAIEFAKNVRFYAAQDFKKEIKLNLLPSEKRSVASSPQPTIQAAGVMRAQNKK
jgi:hypothetical protein